MKKMFVLMSLLMSMTFCVCSCGNAQKGNEEANDSTAVDTVVVDTVAVDSLNCLADTVCIN